MAMVSAGRILILPKGSWDNLASYDMLDMVTGSNNKAYLARKASVGVNPTTDDGTYWQVFGSTVSPDNQTIKEDANGKVYVNIDGVTIKYDSTNGYLYVDADEIDKAIEDLTNVNISNVSNGQVLVYDSTSQKWKNTTISTTLAGLNDTDISNPTDGQVLKYDSVEQKWVNEDDASSKADKTDLTSIIATGSTNNTGATIYSGTYFYLDGTLVRAKANIANGATFTSGTNYEVVTAGGLNSLFTIIKSQPILHPNVRVYKEEITSADLPDIFTDISSGKFEIAHTGMHYTAPSGRKYFFADADYFFGHGDTEMDFHHMLVIEDECQDTAQHQTSNVTTGGATSSLIYTTYLPAHQSELEADFGASHIKEARLLLSNAVSNGAPSGWAWAGKKSFLLNMPMVFGHYLQLLGANEMYNGGNRVRQLALFQAMPETIIARLAATQARQLWWTDDVASAATFGYVYNFGYAAYHSASAAAGVRRAFIID